jgi:hypothetical protein
MGGYAIKSRLQKKLEQFTSEELPLLVEQGYPTEFRKLTENYKASPHATLESNRLDSLVLKSETRARRASVPRFPLPRRGSAVPKTAAIS